MRWGMHKWFLAGFFASGVVVMVAIVIARTFDVSPPLVASCASAIVLVLMLCSRRQAGRYDRFRSKELRCRFPDDLSQRLRRLAGQSSRPRIAAFRYC